jgi:hypothetical protein
MKLIITESRRNEVLTKWLDRKYGNLIPIKHTISTTYTDKSGNGVFFYNGVAGDVTIDNDGLQYDLFNMFGLSRYDLNQIVKPWIEKTYGINVDMVLYTTRHCNNCGKYHPTKYHIDE